MSVQEKDPLPFVTEFSQQNGFINLRIAEPGLSQITAELNPTQVENQQDLKTDYSEGKFLMQPIGYLESCFREKFGTPR